MQLIYEVIFRQSKNWQQYTHKQDQLKNDGKKNIVLITTAMHIIPCILDKSNILYVGEVGELDQSLKGLRVQLFPNQTILCFIWTVSID